MDDAGHVQTRRRSKPTVMGQEHKLSGAELQAAAKAMHKLGYDMFGCEAAYTRDGDSTDGRRRSGGTCVVAPFSRGLEL